MADTCSMVHLVCLFMKTHLLALLQENCLDLVHCAFSCKLSGCVRNITAFCQHLLRPIISAVLADTDISVKSKYQPMYRSISTHNHQRTFRIMITTATTAHNIRLIVDTIIISHTGIAYHVNTSNAGCLETCKRRPLAHDIFVDQCTIYSYFKCQPLSSGSHVFLYKVQTSHTSL